MFFLGDFSHCLLHALFNPILMICWILTFEQLSSSFKIFFLLLFKSDFIPAKGNFPPSEEGLKMDHTI